MSKRPVLVLLAITVLGAIVLGGPWAIRSRPVIAATPTVGPTGSYALTKLAPSQQVCVDPVTLDGRTRVAEFLVATHGGSAQPLFLQVFDRSSYRYEQAVPADYADSARVSVPFTPPPKPTIGGTICLTNSGRRAVWLKGSSEPRTATRADTYTADKPLAQRVQLTLYERDPASILSLLPELLSRMSAWRAGFVGPWLLWPALLLLLAALLGAPPLALRAALRDDEAAGCRGPGEPEEPV